MKTRIRRLFAGLVALALVWASAPALADEKLTLEFWTEAIMDQGAYEAAIAKYTSEVDPSVDILLTYIPFKGADEKVNVALASNTFPDIYMGGAARLGWLSAGGVAADLDIYMPEDYGLDDLNPAVLELCKNKGALQLLPVSINPSALLINRSLFKEAGVEHLIPHDETRCWTREAFVEASAAIAALGDGHYGCGLPAKSYDQDKFIDNYIYNDGTSLTDPSYEAVTYNSPQNVENLKWLIATMTADYAVPGSTGYDLAGLFELFKQGRLGIVNYDTGYYETLMKGIEASEFTADLDPIIVRYPTTEGGVGRMWMSMYGIMVKSQQDAMRVQKSAEFAAWLSDGKDESVVDALYVQKGQTPARKSQIDMIPRDEMKKLAQMPETTVGNVFGTPGYFEMRKQWNTYLQQALLGIITPENALANFEMDAQRLLIDARK